MGFGVLSRADSDDSLDNSISTCWWDTKQKLLTIPRLFAALFIKPEHDGIQSTSDLIYQYGQAVKHIPSLITRLAFKTRTLEDELHEAMLRGNLKKSFHGFDLLMLGVGIVIGSGAFKLTGQGQAEYAGSALVVSYAIAGLACTCTAACYAELCVEYPVAGSAFTYVMVTFGEYPAYLTMGMLVAEYVLAMAAVARGFSQFLAQLLSLNALTFVFDDKGIIVDFVAFGVVLIISLGLSIGVRESTLFLNGATILKLFFIMFICIAGYTQADGDLFTDNFGLEQKTLVDGIFQGTAFIFFAYVAFDAVCNAVEETQRPSRIPGAIIGCVLVSGFMYMLMSVTMSLIILPTSPNSKSLNNCVDMYGHFILPYRNDTCSLDNTPPDWAAFNMAFTVAFDGVGMPWMQQIVAIAALLGITTCLIVGLFSASRIVMVASRTWLLPPQLARISPRTQTPIIAQMIIGVVVAVIALLVKFTALSELVTVAALFAMFMVCNVVLYRRYYPDVKLRYTPHGTVEAEYSQALWWMPGSVLSRGTRRVLVCVHILLINASAIAFILAYRLTLKHCHKQCVSDLDEEIPLGEQPDGWVWSLLLVWLIVTITMFLSCPLEYQPKTWAIKWWLLPFMPSFAILLIIISFGAMTNYKTYIYFGSYFALLTLLYVFFSMPLSYIRHFSIGSVTAENLQVIELVNVDGKYVRWDDLQIQHSQAVLRATSPSDGSFASLQRPSAFAFRPGSTSPGGSTQGRDHGKDKADKVVKSSTTVLGPQISYESSRGSMAGLSLPAVSEEIEGYRSSQQQGAGGSDEKC